MAPCSANGRDYRKMIAFISCLESDFLTIRFRKTGKGVGVVKVFSSLVKQKGMVK